MQLVELMRRRATSALAGGAPPSPSGQQHQQSGPSHADEEAAPLTAPRARGAGGPSAPAAADCDAWRADAAARCRPGLAWAVLFVFVGWPILRHNRLVPRVVWQVLTTAGLVKLAHQMLTFHRWGDEHRYVLRFLVIFLLMIVELLFENCMVWIVSVTDLRKYEDVPGLQDNFEIAFRSLAGRGRLLHWALYGDWVHTKEFLAAALVIAFSVAFDQIPYSGFGVMSRFCASIAVGRLIRVACFLSTVLPNPRPGCYARRFPPPPDSAWEALRIGFTTLRGMGGCNDLIFSGHGAFWTLTPLLLTTYYPRHRWAAAVVWVALVQTSIRDFLEVMHYSVDMLLAVVVTAAVWGWMRRVYPEDRPLQKRPAGAPSDPPNPFVLALAVFGLVVAGVVTFVAKA